MLSILCCCHVCVMKPCWSPTICSPEPHHSAVLVHLRIKSAAILGEHLISLNQSRPSRIVAGITGTRKATLRVWHGEGPPLVRLTLPNKRRKHSAGQWLFVCFPRAGVLHWHPFTISSSAHDDELTVHMKCEGAWTGEIAALADTQQEAKVCR